MPTIETALLHDADAMARFERAALPPAAGAEVTFRGVVRDHDHDRAVRALEYEAHPSAAAILTELATRICADYPDLLGIRLAHRTGMLHVGECAVFAEIFSAHRDAAFTACAQLISELKEKLPIWKRQIFIDGSDEWV